MDISMYHRFADVESTHWWFQGRRRIVADLLRGYLPAARDLRILDVGSGTGEMVDMLTEFGSVTAVDESEDAVRYCRERLGAGVAVRQGRVPEALDAGERFDLVTAFDVVEHIADDVAALRMFRRVLAPGGRLVLTVPAFPVLWSQHDDYSGHHRRYRRAGLARALHAAGGFRIDRITYFNTLLFPPALVARVAERVLRPQREERSDPYLAVPARPVNDLLCRIFAAERGLLRRRDLPFGVSLAAACRAV